MLSPYAAVQEAMPICFQQGNETGTKTDKEKTPYLY